MALGKLPGWEEEVLLSSLRSLCTALPWPKHQPRVPWEQRGKKDRSSSAGSLLQAGGFIMAALCFHHGGSSPRTDPSSPSMDRRDMGLSQFGGLQPSGADFHNIPKIFEAGGKSVGLG